MSDENQKQMADLVQNETMNVLCATDNNYAPYCGVMLTSLFESNKDSRFEVYVFLDGNLTNQNLEKIELLGKKYGNGMHLMVIDNNLLKNCPISKLNGLENHTYIALPTYYRLLAAELLPQSVHRIMYFDCDVAINGDVRPFYNINLDDKAIACVRDCYPLDKETDSRLGYPSGMGYFNAGVAVYNLDYWRENHIGDKLFGYIRENFAKLKYMDQDVVNAVLYDKKVFADERYNYQVLFLASSFWEDYSDGFHQKLIEEGRNVVVAHFCGPVKVWDFRYYGGPFYDIWEKYRRISLWRREGHVTSPRMKYIKFLIKRHVLPRFIKKQMKEQWVSLV